jgi:hypothetical protein
MDPIEGADFGLVCQCGYENFERVIVRRPGRDVYVTDFVACVGCKAVYHLAAYAETGDAQLKSDAAYAAGDYRKPGRR